MTDNKILKSPRDISLTFAKGLTVLKAFDAANTHLTLPQVARITGLDRAIARRLVLTLVHLGYVRQEDRVFSLTPRILVLAGGFLQGRQFGKTVQPILRMFSERVGEAISMAMIDGYEAVYVAHEGHASTVTLGLTVGSRVPLLNTSIGRALIAFSSPDIARGITDTAPLEKLTADSVSERALIGADIALTQDRGYAYVDGEFEAGVAAMSVPVRQPRSEIAALGISASRARFKSETFRKEVLDALTECSNAVGGLL